MSTPTTYTSEQHALDKINVRETMAAMYWYADVNELDKLVDRAFAPLVTLDYSALFGWPAKEQPAQAQADEFKTLLAQFEQTAHVLTAAIDELPAPDATAAAPQACTAHATVFVYLRKRRAGATLESRSYSRVAFDLVRAPAALGNPWRIRGAKFAPVWSADPDGIWEP